MYDWEAMKAERLGTPVARLIKDFDREIKEEESNYSPATNKQLNERKQSLVRDSSFPYMNYWTIWFHQS